MTDGEILKNYVNSLQNVTIKSIYEGLGMSKTNFYQFYDTQEFEPDTKQKLEDFFGVKIFDQKPKNFIEERRNKKLNGGEGKEIQVYAPGTKAGFITIYEDDSNRNHVPVGSLNPSIFPGCNHAEKITGDSMYPMIINQGIVVGDLMDDYRAIVSGERYVIHTSYGLRTCKYIHTIEKQPERIKLVALNKGVPAQIVELKDITLLMRVYFIINPA